VRVAIVTFATLLVIAPAHAHEPGETSDHKGVGAGGAAETTAPGYRPLAFAAPVAGTYELRSLGEAADGPLLDDAGRPLRLHDLFGDRIAVLSFVYTTCHDTNGCPLASFVLAGVQSRLLATPTVRDHVRMITVTFDPDHDRPDVMRAYGARLRTAPVDWRFLTARSEAELAPTLAAYGQSVRKDYDADGKYLGTISHVLRVYLVDRKERIRNIYSTSYLHPDLLLADIETLLAEEKADPGGAPGSEKPRAPSARPEPAMLGLPPLPAAPPGAATVALGRRLFFDRRLSANDTLSCAMCHVPEQGFTNNEIKTAVGIEGRTVKRNAPTLYNVAYAPVLFHDGRARTLEEQAWSPLLAHDEMGNASAEDVVAKLGGLPDYARLFADAFGNAAPSRDTIARALAGYERTLLAAGSAFDRWRFADEDTALTGAAQAGFSLFTGKAGCAQCHAIAADHALFTDYAFHDTGVALRSRRVASDRARGAIELAPGVALHLDEATAASLMPPADDGRYEVTRDPADMRKYKTPSLRNVALTAPYMHDGSLPTLRAVVDFYDGGGEPDALLDPRIRRLGLSDDEKEALVAFLESLSGDTERFVADALSTPVGNPN
jgi:cytochrome c peroxidase